MFEVDMMPLDAHSATPTLHPILRVASSPPGVVPGVPLDTAFFFTLTRSLEAPSSNPIAAHPPGPSPQYTSDRSALLSLGCCAIYAFARHIGPAAFHR